MLIRTNIENKLEVSKKYLKLMRRVDSPSNDQIRSINIKHLSCALCLRFLKDPVMHAKCGFFFCSSCLVPWIEHFGFCNRCRTDWTPAEIGQLEIDQRLNKILKSIKIDCCFGECSKKGIHQDRERKYQTRFGDKTRQKMMNRSKPSPGPHALNADELTMIQERSMESESMELEKKTWEGGLDRGLPISRLITLNASTKPSISKSFLNSSRQSDLSSSSNLQESTLAHSLGLSRKYTNEYKRYYNTVEYTFHLMKFHFWPIMEIKVRQIRKKNSRSTLQKMNQLSSLNKYSDSEYEILKSEIKIDKNESTVSVFEYCGYKQGAKLGPGVMYFVHSSRRIDTYLGNFEKNALKGEVTIFQNGKMMYDGGIQKGLKDGLATERFQVVLATGDEYLTDQSQKDFGYLEYRGHFKKGKREGRGRLVFRGKYYMLKSHFRDLEKQNELELRNMGILDSDGEEEYPHDIPLIKSRVDPKFDVNNLFGKVPVLLVDSERKINHEPPTESTATTMDCEPAEEPNL